MIDARPSKEPLMAGYRARMFVVAALAASCGWTAGTARADVVTDWNEIALGATADPPNSILQSRVLAIVHAAVYDAVVAVEGKGRAYAADVKAAPGASVEAAVAAAAHGTLVRLVPARKQALDDALGRSLGKIADAKGKSDGVRLGEQVAEQIVALRRADGSAARAGFVAKPGPGQYEPTPPHSMAPILAHWGAVAPFVLRGRGGVEFRGPPLPTSADFARDFSEVKSIGRRDSATRTADQTAAAIFWTVQTAVPWHAAARSASAARSLSIHDNARLFALLSIATADSQIVAFDEKYKRPHWRPITAIRAAASLGIPGLEGEAAWEPLLGTPPHPEYPSAHAVFSGAAEAVLKAFFGTDAMHFSVTFPPLFGITRSYRRFSEMSEEVDNARVWGGIHFRSADRDGSVAGRQIGEIVMRDFPRAVQER
jgi:hypothetical protein